LMIMPGRSWVAGIDIAGIALLTLICGMLFYGWPRLCLNV